MQVTIPDNIEKYKVRSLSDKKGQLGYLLLAIAVFLALSILSLFLISNFLLKILAITGAALLCVPILIAGFVPFMGLSLGEVARRCLQNNNRPFRRDLYE